MKTIIYCTLSLFWLVACYGMWAFYNLSFSPQDWGAESRFLFLFCGPFFSAGAIVVLIASKD